MPELPEVETMRRGIAPCVGQQIVRVERPRCRKRPILITPAAPVLYRRLQGRTIAATDRLGKRVCLRLDSGDTLLFEPRMTGLVLLADPPTSEHLRFRLLLGDGSQLLYWDRRGLGSVRLYSPEELAGLYPTEKLGPDALAITAEQLRGRLKASRREIKVALLDQRAVAGIGNLYAAEILHVAGVHPRQRCDRLRIADYEAIHTAMWTVLHEAIAHEGSTLSDGTYRNALNQAGGYQNHHRVYDRAGQACGCGRGTIERIVQAQRSTFYCPACQRRGTSRRSGRVANA